LAERWREFSDLRTIAHIEVQRGDQSRRFTGVLLVKRPHSLRFEALSPFGQPVLFVVIHDGQLTAYDATTGEATVGRASSATMADLLGLPFEPQDLVSVLAGLAVPPDDLRAAEALTPDAIGPSIKLYGPVHAKRIWLSEGSDVVRQQEIEGGRYAARVTYERATGGGVAGFTVTAEPTHLAATVSYRNPVINVGIDPERFAFTLPAGTRISPVP
jgi:hypothetical protein